MSEVYIMEKNGEVRHVRADKKSHKMEQDGWQTLASVHGFNMSVSVSGKKINSELRTLLNEIVADSDRVPVEEWVDQSIDKLRKLIFKDVKRRITRSEDI